MSVMLYNKKSITKIIVGLVNNDVVIDEVKNLKHYNERCSSYPESPEDYITRMVWYMYVGNVTAYNLQYRENQMIDFKEYDVKVDEDIEESLNKLGGLLYNVYTNDGNFFVDKQWLDSADDIKKKLNCTKELTIHTKA
tara:strand:- start:401 stop:814 length:414 start_codon:yes stop_codon:yes gene_type:complete